MKNFFLLKVVLCCLAVNVYLIASAETDPSAASTVVRVEGEAMYSLGDNNWKPLYAGRYLAPGTTIKTSENGSVDIILGKSVATRPFASSGPATPTRLITAQEPKVRGTVMYAPSITQNVIRLAPNSILKIDKLTVSDTGLDSVSDTELDLQKGKIYAKVKKLSATSQFLIKLPNGIAGVRGTTFVLDAGGNCICTESEGGGVMLSFLSGGEVKTINVPPGYMLTIDYTTSTVDVSPNGTPTRNASTPGGRNVNYIISPVTVPAADNLDNIITDLIGKVTLQVIGGAVAISVDKTNGNMSPNHGVGNGNGNGNGKH